MYVVTLIHTHDLLFDLTKVALTSVVIPTSSQVETNAPYYEDQLLQGRYDAGQVLARRYAEQERRIQPLMVSLSLAEAEQERSRRGPGVVDPKGSERRERKATRTQGSAKFQRSSKQVM